MTSGPLGEVTCVKAEACCVSGSSGQIRPGGDQGLFIRDTRVLNRLLVLLDGAEPSPLDGRATRAAVARFTAHGDRTFDRHAGPRLFLDRRRIVSGSMSEEVRLINNGLDARDVVVELLAGTDFAYIFDVKHGRVQPEAPATAERGGLRFRDGDTGRSVLVHPDHSADEIDAEGARLRWSVRLAPRGAWTVTISIELTENTSLPREDAAQEQPSPWAPLDVRCSDGYLSALAERSVADLASLLVRDPADPSDRFAAAGSPWFLTLFGRDSLWAATMALPLDVGLAGETLRTLARRQGRRHEPETEEAPGKILHEVRHGGLVERSDLPPRYYGSIDATPLWITLLNEAWRWGLPEQQVEQLLPAMERALRWMHDDGDADGDGFLEYRQSGSRGLANQGWKDAGNAISFADGRLAAPPIALCEVQGYGYEAALRGAELLDHFGLAGADEWRAWADALRERFRSAFWIDGPDGAYPAIALDGDKRPVDSVASNMGHLPATGLLDEAEIALVADRLSSSDMDCGWGLRTLSDASPRFNPLSYHCGSVWPHDTAIAISNLAATGHGEPAGRLIRGLVAAGPFFDYRLPELFGGERRAPGDFPLPYPAACRPQAWAAGAALLMLRSLLGLYPNLPRGELTLRPLWPTPFARLDLVGLPIAGHRLSMAVVRDQGVSVAESPPGLKVTVECP